MPNATITLDLQARSEGTGWIRWTDVNGRDREETVDATREHGRWILYPIYLVEHRCEGRTLQEAARHLARAVGCDGGTLVVGKEFGDWSQVTHKL